MSTHKTAIVTGAGSGIGRQTALLLAQAGYSLVLAARTRTKLEETAELADQISTSGVEMVIAPTDLCDPQAAADLAAIAVESLGRIDAIAHVAGNAPLLPIEQITPDIWRQCVDTNLSSIIALTAAAWPVFCRQNSGIIASVSSLASVDPFPHFSIYAAAKVGLNMFTRCTAQEGKAIGLRAVAIAPGAVETPMLRSVFDTSVIPADRTLQPQAVAQVICDCITGRRPFEPGETILLPSP